MLRLRAILAIVLIASTIRVTVSSVIFPGGPTAESISFRRRQSRWHRKGSVGRGGVLSSEMFRQAHSISGFHLPLYSQHSLAFSPAQAGKFLSLGLILSFLGQQIQSESVRRAAYFWFHAGPVVLHYKFTRWYLTTTNASLEKRNSVYNSLHDRYCNRCLDIALHLKGLYVKIAQIVSSRPDFVPPQYIELFTSVQDSIPQSDVEEIVRIVDDNLQQELGKGFDKVFESVDPVALGSASIGQVHRAKLRDGAFSWDYGDEVAVKVMHTGVEDRFHHDFQVFRRLCKVALTGWEPILDECYRQIMTEFDYRNEAESLDFVRSHMICSRFNKLVQVPKPCLALSTKKVLVMEMLHGKKLSDSFEDDLANALGGVTSDAHEFIRRKRLEMILGEEKMEQLGYSSDSDFNKVLKSLGMRNKMKLLFLYRKVQKYIDLLVDVQGYQMLKLGVFNGDPHAGNLLCLNDGRLGLIDFGQTKRITDEQRLDVARVVSAIGHGQSDKQVADAMRRLGFATKYDKDDVLAKYAALFFDSDIEGKRLGCATPQIYFSTLNKLDQLVNVPDVAIFVARSSFIIRGMGTLLGQQVRTASRWKNQAQQAIDK
mmetsp:Transcript_81788/g.237139  ORF Transcript_81788/g.237139 Transcript_81788/m.237139 type:complete len:598 (-) Transcript_81788:312-2105(-)